ncbi:hypothetical protein HHI36_005093 [Cryptolaemus montrouzieri]|uniref:Mitochondrial fission 1 protein n=1 Tax=Cryptolaemus montrouzieri TaxID=559131 RepID=A0ABD2NTI8_9CUCU
MKVINTQYYHQSYTYKISSSKAYKMTDILTETVSPADLKKFEQIYHEQLYKNNVTPKAQFEYAWCLVRSKYSADIKKGIILLEELYNTNKEGQRDYLYYLALGTARLKEYSKALDFCKAFLSVEPGKTIAI